MNDRDSVRNVLTDRWPPAPVCSGPTPSGGKGRPAVLFSISGTSRAGTAVIWWDTGMMVEQGPTADTFDKYLCTQLRTPIQLYLVGCRDFCTPPLAVVSNI